MRSCGHGPRWGLTVTLLHLLRPTAGDRERQLGMLTRQTGWDRRYTLADAARVGMGQAGKVGDLERRHRVMADI